MTIAIVTGIYPPKIGGAGGVMHSLATHAPDRIAVITEEFDRGRTRVSHEEERAAKQPQVYRIAPLSHILKWPPRGKFRGICQAVYDRFVLQPRATRALIKILNSLRPELVCIGTLPSSYWVVRAVRAWQPNMKILMYVHGEDVPPRNGGFHSQRRLQALQGASMVVAVSSFTKSALVNVGIPSDQIAVITNGVDIVRFQPGEKNAELIKRYDLAGRPVLLTLARLDERKGQDMLLRALPKIRAAVPDVAYLIVGEGGYGNTLRKLVAELHLEDTVIFTGAVADEEVVEFYRTCDVYAMPNRTTEEGDTEGFGLVFLEAGACGKAVIGGAAGGVPDAVLHQKTGLLVDGTSAEEIANSCIRLLNDASLRNEFGANGLAHARANDWQKKTQQFLALCDTIARP